MQKKIYLLRFSKWWLGLCMMLLAGSLQAQSVLDKNMVITAKSMTIRQLFQAMESETGVQLSYGTAISAILSKQLTLEAKKTNLRDVLTVLKNATGLSYAVNGNF